MTSRSSKDGLQFLSDDHQVIFGLFDKVKAATNVQQKKEIVDKIVSTVSQHACIEEQYMYPLIQSKLGETKWMDRVYTDDQINKEVLQLLLEMDPETNVKEDVYDRAINKFILMETEHLNEEDEQIFPELRKNMNEQELAILEDNLRIAKQVAPTRPHPRAPVVGAKVLQPIVGVLDRTVDAVLGRQIIE